MRSFAVWYDSRKAIQQLNLSISITNEVCIEAKQGNLENDTSILPDNTTNHQIAKDMLHVNFWSPFIDSDICYFDFGIYVDDVTELNNIYVYCPFKVNKQDVRDLGARMSSDNLVKALFNENYVTTNGNAKRYLIDKNDANREKFIVYALDEDNEIETAFCKRDRYKSDKHDVDGNGCGTIIDLKLANLRENSSEILKEIKSYYFRFRIEVHKNDLKLISTTIKSESWITDTLVTTEVMDFRINDIRSCCDEIQDRFNRGLHFNFKAVHYLVMCNADDKVIAEGNSYTCRLLELDVWKKYIDVLKDNIIAYHFKEKANGNDSVKDLVVLVRFQKRKSKLESILKYIIIILVLGVITNKISDCITFISN